MPPKSLKQENYEADPILRRFAWILENRNDNGKPWNATSLARAAGMSDSHLRNILGGHGQGANLTRDTIVKYARAADVRTEWLLSGAGEPGTFVEEETSANVTTGGAKQAMRIVEYDDPYPERPPALAYLKNIVSPEVLDTLRTMSTKPRDGGMSHQDWIDEGIALERRRRRDIARLDEPEAPPPATSAIVPTSSPVTRESLLARREKMKTRKR